MMLFFGIDKADLRGMLIQLSLGSASWIPAGAGMTT